MKHQQLDQVLWQLYDKALREHTCALGSCGSVFSERAATLPLMSLCVAETERLMHSGSSPLAATGQPRATADDSFNCFQSFRLVPAQWRRVLVCVCAALSLAPCERTCVYVE